MITTASLHATLLALVPAVLSAQQAQDEIPEKKRTSLGLHVTARKAAEMMKTDPGTVQLIDVRTPEEYMFVGHVPKTRNIPGWFVEYDWDAAKKKPKMRANPNFITLVRKVAGPRDTILLMCRSGVRSAKGVELLAGAGFTRVYSVVDGFEGDKVKVKDSPLFGKRTVNGWKNAGLPWTCTLDPELMYLPGTIGTAAAPPDAHGVHEAWTADRWGSMREALRNGQTHARIDLAAVARKGVYAIGALADLKGEITILDGDVWISRGLKEGPRTTCHETAEATMLFSARVPRWKTIAIETDVDPSEFDAFIAKQARALNLPVQGPLPFVIEGRVHELQVHVIAGQCPTRARILGKQMTTPPFRKQYAEVEAKLVGMFAENAAGIMTHMGSTTHVHALIQGDVPLTAHVESVGLAAGAVLKLPTHSY